MVRLMGYSLLLALVIGILPACGGNDDDDDNGNPSFNFSACDQTDHPARLTHHAEVGQIDHCQTPMPEYVKLLTNWGMRPEWISKTEMVFVSNHMGHVWRMDIASGEMENLTDHFEHAGFSRAQPLINGDLLLTGLLEGEPLLDEPLVEYSPGRYKGEMFVFPNPFDGEPLPLNEHAWEGAAVSRESLRIAWSTTDVPVWIEDENGEIDFMLTAQAYANEPSDLVTAVIAYDANGMPTLTERRTVLSKEEVGPYFLEAQDFRGEGDAQLLASAYGPAGNGSDLLIVDMDGDGFEQFHSPDGDYYEEWEGLHPDQTVGFVEIDPEAVMFPTGTLNLMLYDFSDRSYALFASSAESPVQVEAGARNPVWSDDGNWVLAGTDAVGEEPGYSAGIMLFDVEAMPPLPER